MREMPQKGGDLFSPFARLRAMDRLNPKEARMARYQTHRNLARRIDEAMQDEGLHRPYAFVSRGSAVGFLGNVARRIAEDWAAGEALAQPDHHILSDIKPRTKPADSLSIKSLYWSVQHHDPLA